LATAKKLTRKALKKPDEFVRTGRTVVEWLTEHARTVAILGSVIVVVGVGLTLGIYFASRRSLSAADALGDALALSERPVTKAPEAGKKTFPTKAARTAAFRKALQGVRKAHGGTPPAAEAALQLGNLDLKAKKYDAAVGHFKSYLAEAAHDAPFRFAALEGIGAAEEAKGDKKAALAAYKRLVAQGNAFYKPFALVREARVLAELGQTDAARDTAQTVLDQFASSPAKDDAERLIDGLPPAPTKDAAKKPAAAASGKKQEG